MTPGPQLENGYTKIANELLDAIAKSELSKRQLKIVLAVIRKTYGYNKKVDDMTVTQLVESTNIDKSAVSRTLPELEAMNVLSKRQGKYGYVLGLNKNYRGWKPLSKRQRCQNDNSSCQNDNSELSKRQTQKTYTKDNPKRKGEASDKSDSPTLKARKGKTLPKDWTLPEDWKQWTITNCPRVDPMATAEEFKDWALGNANRPVGKKADWFATWRNWCRRDQEKYTEKAKWRKK